MNNTQTDDQFAGALNLNKLTAALNAGEHERLQLSLTGFAGPIDLLLELAREQKVDLAQISILQLADQYLNFIDHAKNLKIELAADYLVMAAWLAYLKSCLLLPMPEIDEEDVSPHLMAAALRFRLQRLEAMRNAAREMMSQPQLGQHRLKSGGEPMREETEWRWTASFYDLIGAYARMETRAGKRLRLRINLPRLFSVEEAAARLAQIFAEMRPAWHSLMSLLPTPETGEPLVRKSALSSTFAATLEMCREGKVHIRQDSAFAPIFVKPAEPAAEEHTEPQQ
ncbi:MAG: segregation/condensation protein A [Alphaproteobacteria bacterium]|nr:segregation/condensation protein A [Alphaproteobacteria bacterium]MDA7988307.1 segregation/condensation protein A [Alphaproteobacteria bacterium]MDA7999777.1 segregation/condensation protein A [Alphaproteobacteria bacterium]MDA8003375.1 segregation/condensation protein A [Alphaproteobacteria bacterium]MDA8005113.1 segregation/condensation protein A [Alphaproteobacteria bacterium]